MIVEVKRRQAGIAICILLLYSVFLYIPLQSLQSNWLFPTNYNKIDIVVDDGPWPPKHAIDSLVDDENSIVVLIVNCGYAAMAENSVQSIRRAGVSNFVIVPRDETVRSIFSSIFPTHTLPVPPLSIRQINTNESIDTEEEAFTYGTKGFVSFNHARAYVIRSFLLHGFTVFYCDLDTVWRSNILPQLHFHSMNGTLPTELQGANYSFAEYKPDKAVATSKNLPSARSIDYTFELIGFEDQHPTLCSGFIYARPTPMVLEVLQAWHQMMQNDTSMTLDDQSAFNVIVRDTYATRLRHSILRHDGGIPNGKVFFKEWVDDPIKLNATKIIHNNFIKGYDNKRKRFEDYGLWNLSSAFRHLRYNCSV